MKKTIKFLKDEGWYGGAVDFGEKYPVFCGDELFIDTSENTTNSQLNPVFISDKGRYIWLENGGSVHFSKGKIIINAPEVVFKKAGKTLKQAAIAAARAHYPPSGKTPDKTSFSAPQYCSWTVLLWNQNQQKILEYARSIIANGFKPGILIIDDTWQKDYGVWEFNPAYFPDPKGMMTELKNLGFKVMLWICPYISPDSPKSSEYAPWIFDHIKEGRIITDEKGKPLFSSWWEGYSAQLDFVSSSAAKRWINENARRLIEDYGVFGFKMDGGDAEYFERDYKYKNAQSTLWIDSVDCGVKEARCLYKLANKPLICRLNDKKHSFKSANGTLGLSSLIPCVLAQGLIGYVFGCPDMVGGGLSCDFIDKSGLDDELIVRWCQASALLPMVQFSLDVWNRKQNRVAEICKKTMDLREKLTPYIVEKLTEAGASGVPAVRYLEYEYPRSGYSGITDEFMLGEKYLVAPVLEKGARKRKVVFPEGKWKDVLSGEIYSCGVSEVFAPIDKLPVFEKF